VQFDNGGTRSYRLVPGNARYGFVISPFLYNHDQLLAANANTNSLRIVAARVRVANERAVAPSIRFVTHTIHGVWAFGPEPSPHEPTRVNAETTSSAHRSPPVLESEKVRSVAVSNAPPSNVGASNATNGIARAVDP